MTDLTDILTDDACPFCGGEFVGYSTILVAQNATHLLYECKACCGPCGFMAHTRYELVRRDD